MKKERLRKIEQKVLAIIAVFAMFSSYVPAINYIAMAVEEVVTEQLEELQEGETIVTFNDNYLKEKLLQYDTNGDGELSKKEMEQITDLFISYTTDEKEMLKDLLGLEYAINLKFLQILTHRNLENISVLSNLTNLERLELYLGGYYEEKSEIIDISFLENLTKLNTLRLDMAGIEDITPIRKLTQLDSLSLRDNKIKDITPLQSLTNLTYLDLSNNNIEDLTLMEEIKKKNPDADLIARSQRLKKDLGAIDAENNHIEIELPQYFSNVFDTNNPFYAENWNITATTEYNSDHYVDEIYFSEDKTKLIVDAERKLGERKINCRINYLIGPDVGYSCYISDSTIDFTFRLDSLADQEQEIEFASEKLKQKLLDSYDADQNGKITLYDMEKIEELAFENDNNEIMDIEGIQYCKNLKDLDIYGKFTNLQVLQKLPILRSLRINGTEDIVEIEAIPNLEKLYISRADLNTINLFHVNQNMKELMFFDCTNIANLQGIEGLESLNTLMITDCQSASDFNINIISNLTNLTNLAISNMEIENTAFLNQLKKLETLSLNRTNIQSIENIIKLENLTELNLSNNKISDISKINELQNLTLLNLSYNQISNIENIEKSIHLTNLNLSGNQIESIENIVNAPNDLQFLDVSYNNIQNLDEIERLNIYHLTCAQDITIDNVQVTKGQKIEIDVPEIFHKMNDANSKFYVEDSSIYITSMLYGDPTHVTLKEDRTKIVIDATDVRIGNYQEMINIGYEQQSTSSGTRITIRYKVFEDVSEKVEINIEDLNFKKYLLKNYDVDNDGKITNYDMIQIKNLTIDYNNPVSSLKGIEYATNLETLNLYVHCKDISSIFQLTKLKMLHLTIIEQDLTNIDRLQDLERLSININYPAKTLELSKIATLEKLKNLYIRDLSQNNVVIDCDKIKNLQNLEELILEGNLINYEKIGDLTSLNYLTLSTKNNINNIEFIRNLIDNNMHYLNLSRNKITDITPLQDLHSLISVNLTQNPINQKETGNATTLQILRNRNVHIDIDEYNESENIIFQDENFKQCLLSRNVDRNNDGEISYFEMEQLTNFSIDIYYPNTLTSMEEIQYAKNLTSLTLQINSNGEENLDLMPIKNLTKLTKLTFYRDYKNMEGFEFLENLNNLQELSIYNINRDFDLKNLGNYQNLKKINLSSNNKLYNLEELGKITNLEELSITTGNSMLDVGVIAQSRNLKKLDLSGQKIVNLESLEQVKNLTDLTIRMGYVDETLSFQGISTISNLKNFSIQGDLCDITNFEEICQLQNLEKVKINYNGHMRSSSSDMILASKQHMKKEEEWIQTIQNVNCNNIQMILGNTVANIGNVDSSSTKEVKWKELSPVINAMMTEGNKLYCENFTFRNMSYGNQYITINEENQTITVKANESIGTKTESIGTYLQYINDTGNPDSAQGSINIYWNNITQGDKTKEIMIPDSNLKNVLLENYDIDQDGKITEYDIINISNLDIGNKNITNLEGLQYAKNLVVINAPYNNISDITPIINLEKIEVCILNNNIITDISCLDEVKWSNEIYDETINFSNNYINFEEGNDNYNALKKLLYRQIAEGRESLIFANTINNQNVGEVDQIDDVVELEANLKAKLIEYGIDQNHDNEITKKELMAANQVIQNELDLSNCNITNLSGLEYLNISVLNLSNNNITDITPITENKNINYLNLSNNQISDITGIDNCFGIFELNLSNNNITDITPITNLYKMQEDTLAYDWCYGYRIMDINLSNNQIKNIDCVANWKNIRNLDLSNNQISNIAKLKDYNFRVSQVIDDTDFVAGSITIDLTSNCIDMTKTENRKAQQVFQDKGTTMTVDNQTTIIQPSKKGDMDGDGLADPYDAYIINVMFEEGRIPTQKELEIGDIDGDGTVDPYDAYLINVAFEEGRILD